VPINHAHCGRSGGTIKGGTLTKRSYDSSAARKSNCKVCKLGQKEARKTPRHKPPWRHYQCDGTDPGPRPQTRDPGPRPACLTGTAHSIPSPTSPFLLSTLFSLQDFMLFTFSVSCSIKREFLGLLRGDFTLILKPSI